VAFLVPAVFSAPAVHSSPRVPLSSPRVPLSSPRVPLSREALTSSEMLAVGETVGRRGGTGDDGTIGTSWNLLMGSEDAIPAPRWGNAWAVQAGVLTVVSGARPRPGDEAILSTTPVQAYTWGDEWTMRTGFETTSWTNNSLPAAFTGRYDHSAACVATTQGLEGEGEGEGVTDGTSNCTLVVYGGRSASGAILKDMWIKKSPDSAWVTARQAGDPPATGLSGHTAVALTGLDPSVLVYGGDDGGKTGSSDVYRMRLIESNKTGTLTAMWERLSSGGDSRTGSLPGSRRLHSAVAVHRDHDSVMLMYGGCEGASPSPTGGGTTNDGYIFPGAACDQGLSDLWQLTVPHSAKDKASWTLLDEQAGAGARAAHSATLQESPDGLAMVIVGGHRSQLRYDTWYYSLATEMWVHTPGHNCAVPNGNACEPLTRQVEEATFGCNSAYKPVLTGDLLPGMSMAFFGTASTFEEWDPSWPDSQWNDWQASAWQLELTLDQSPMCGDKGKCWPDPDEDIGAVCECEYGFSDSDDSCSVSGDDFQWYLMYTAFGVIILFFSFLARRLHLCCRRRGIDGSLRHPLNPDALGGAQPTWTKSQLDELINGEAAARVNALPQCPICFEDDCAGLMALPCRHMLCEECACKIFGTRLECPFCRGEITSAKRLEVDANGEDISEIAVGCDVGCSHHPDPEDEDEDSTCSAVRMAESPTSRTAGGTLQDNDESMETDVNLLSRDRGTVERSADTQGRTVDGEGVQGSTVDGEPTVARYARLEGTDDSLQEPLIPTDAP